MSEHDAVTGRSVDLVVLLPVSAADNLAGSDENVMQHVLGKVQDLAGAVEVTSSDRSKVALTQPGDFVIARLDAIVDSPNFGGRIYHLTDIDGERLYMNGSKFLDSVIAPSLVGDVIGIFLVDLRSTGKASPMKVFRVFTFGNSFPELD